MSVKYFLVILSYVLFLPVIIGSDYSMLDSDTDVAENIQISQNLTTIQLQTIYVIPNPSRIPSANISENCSLAFESFSSSVVNFTSCTIKYARPIHICMKCGNEYKSSVNSYANLKKQEADCQEFFFSSDQLGIVDIIYSGADSLWKKSFCQSCYDHNDESDNFFKISEDLMTCIQRLNKSAMINPNSTCQECHFIFANLSTSYNNFVQWKTNVDDGICMDIVDTMNISRRIWNEYNCNIGFDTNIGFLNILTAFTVCSTPVMFYLLAKNISRLEDVKIVPPKRKVTTVTPPEQSR